MNNLFMIENGQADIFDFIVIVKSWANSLSSVDGDDVGQSAEGKFDTYLENMIDAEKSKTVWDALLEDVFGENASRSIAQYYKWRQEQEKKKKDDATRTTSGEENWVHGVTLQDGSPVRFDSDTQRFTPVESLPVPNDDDKKDRIRFLRARRTFWAPSSLGWTLLALDFLEWEYGRRANFGEMRIKTDLSSLTKGFYDYVYYLFSPKEDSRTHATFPRSYQWAQRTLEKIARVEGVDSREVLYTPDLLGMLRERVQPNWVREGLFSTRGVHYFRSGVVIASHALAALNQLYHETVGTLVL